MLCSVLSVDSISQIWDSNTKAGTDNTWNTNTAISLPICWWHFCMKRHECRAHRRWQRTKFIYLIRIRTIIKPWYSFNVDPISVCTLSRAARSNPAPSASREYEVMDELQTCFTYNGKMLKQTPPPDTLLWTLIKTAMPVYAVLLPLPISRCIVKHF